MWLNSSMVIGAAQGDGQKRLTIREVADLAGVSAATVSRVINGRPDVSEPVRESVMRVVRENGYSRSRSGGVSGGSGLVGVTLPLLHHSYFSEILAGVSEAFYEEGIPMVLCPTMHEHDREASLLERLRQGTTDGAILILPEESHEELSALRAGLPVCDRRSAHGPGRACADRLGGPYLRCQGGDRAPGEPRPPPRRGDHRPQRLACD